MKQSFFCKSFYFCTVTRYTESHTDNSSGINLNYIARMHSGTGIIKTLEHEELHLKPGDVFFLPRGLKYHSYWLPDSKNNLPAKWDSYGFYHLPDMLNRKFDMQHIYPASNAMKYLDNLQKNYEVNPTSIGNLYLFLGEVIDDMKESYCDPDERLVQIATEFIGNNTDFKVKELAAYCGMSESSLFKFLKRKTGFTPVEIKKQILSQRITELLCSTDRTVEDIASELGFCSSAHLRKTLKSITGKTPSYIRKNSKLI